jgi:hypothetical protein
MSEFKQYRRKQIAELRPFVPGTPIDPSVSISLPDLEAGSPKAGDMIARNPKNHAWHFRFTLKNELRSI